MRNSHLLIVGLMIIGSAPVRADYLELRRNANIYEESTRHSDQIGRLEFNHQSDQFISLASEDLRNGYYEIEIPGSSLTGFVYRSRVRRFEGDRPDLPDATTATGDASFLEDATFTVHFVDVGTGDAAIIDMGEQEIIIDGGNYINDLWRYIDDRDLVQGPVELAIVTHADTDHWRGLHRYLGFDDQRPDVEVTEFWEPGYDRNCRQLDSYDAFIAAMMERVTAAGYKRPLEGEHAPATGGTVQSFTRPQLDGVVFTILWSDEDPDATDCAYRINNASIVAKIEIEDFSFLFTGDANGKERDDIDDDIQVGHVEAALLELNPITILEADVLKVPHHGSETASTTEFIEAVDPRFVVISASTSHHLPRQTVINRYESPLRDILRTDAQRERGNDHIICFPFNAELVCNYEYVFE